MLNVDTQCVIDLEGYINSHALPDNGGYLLLEEEIEIGVPFMWEFFPLRVSRENQRPNLHRFLTPLNQVIGTYNSALLSIKGDVGVFVPIKGWTTIYHFSGSLTKGITAEINTPVAKGTITFNVEDWEGAEWFTLTVKVWVIGNINIDNTFRLFKISPIHTDDAQRTTNSAAVSNLDLNKQWIEHLHLFSKLALENGGAQLVSAVRLHSSLGKGAQTEKTRRLFEHSLKPGQDRSGEKAISKRRQDWHYLFFGIYTPLFPYSKSLSLLVSLKGREIPLLLVLLSLS